MVAAPPPQSLPPLKPHHLRNVGAETTNTPYPNPAPNAASHPRVGAVTNNTQLVCEAAALVGVGCHKNQHTLENTLPPPIYETAALVGVGWGHRAGDGRGTTNQKPPPNPLHRHNLQTLEVPLTLEVSAPRPPTPQAPDALVLPPLSSKP